jgi:hypothetical protein
MKYLKCLSFPVYVAAMYTNAWEVVGSYPKGPGYEARVVEAVFL